MGYFALEMKADWRSYPDNANHYISPGCFRCHDGEHVSENNKTITRDCNACHTIVSQGYAMDVESITKGGLEFEHPGEIGDAWREGRCDACHRGAPEE